ncbi:MAG: Fe-S cluster assembly protein SufD [Candidatus Puniceispirillaceae bacterium]
MGMRGWSMPHKLTEIISWPDHCVKAQSYFDTYGWPDNRQEAWKYTSLAHLQDSAFTAADTDDNTGAADIQGKLDGLVINISGGEAQLPPKQALGEGISVTDIRTDDALRAAIFSQLADNHLLTALSALHQTSAIAIDIQATADGGDTAPIILNMTGGNKDAACYSFVIVRVHKGARGRIAEIHSSQAGLSCPLMVYDVQDNAELHHIRLQKEADHTTHLGLNQMQMGKNSQINSFAISMGGTLSRLETHSLFQDTDSHLAQSAIYLGCDRQHHDITSFVAHEMRDCASRQLIRGVLDDKARGVFQGKVRVAPDAQKTDGQQMSRALLLSRDAEADAKPELEIFADDVVCSHGATVGELDENLMFYLKSRGISETDARDMLIDAFLVDTLEEIEDASFAAFMAAQISGWSRARR